MTGNAGHALGLSIWSTLILAGTVLLSRRATGALTSPLPPVMLTFLTASVATLSLIAYAGVCRQQPTGTTRRTVAGGVSWAAAILPILGVAPPAIMVAAAAVSMLFLVLGWTVSRVTDRGHSQATPQAARLHQDSGRVTENPHQPRSDDPVADDPRSDDPVAVDPVADDPVADTAIELDQQTAALPVEHHSDHVVQRLTRSLEGGVDVLEGAIRVDFAAGQKLAVVHIPFWPAFSCPPRIDCETMDCRAKVAAVHVYGTRIEVKRPHGAEPQQLWLDVCATADETERMAA